MDYQQAMRLDAKGFVVLGAGQGIGLETTRALAQQGATVLCVDRDEALARSAAEANGAHHAVADVTREGDVARIFAGVQSMFGDGFAGVVDIVGMADIRPIADFSEQDWDRQFAIVLRHASFVLKHASPIFPSAGGSMVFISSLAGIRSMDGQGVYGAAKAALNHLVATAALELGPRGIRVNAIAPGITRTPRVASVLKEDGLNAIAETVPLRRVGLPEDIAAAVLFLSSNLARSISGVTLPVDGGITNVSIFPRLDVGRNFMKAAETAANRAVS